MCSGECDEASWGALVEASWRFGSRLLFITAPNLRGDDVVELQSRLAHLGFDSGRVDGIFGPDTARALEHFQRSCGLPTDAVCGPETIVALEGLARQSGTGPGVAMLREEELRRSPSRRLSALKVVIGHDGGLSSIARATARSVRSAGAAVVPLDDPDPRQQARTANEFGADVYVGLHASEERVARIVYYEVPAFTSLGGRALASQLRACLLNRRIFETVEVEGLRLQILRETRMPAVWCELGPARHVSDHAVALAAACVDALHGWALTTERDPV